MNNKEQLNTIKVFESFSGYGSQSIALDNIGVPHKVVAISEIDPDAIIAYAAIKDCDLDKELDVDIDTARQILKDKNVGWDFQKQKSSITRMKKDKLKKLYNADKFVGNLGDVSILDTPTIPNHDLFTYSFPCQSISVAGKGEGLSKGKGTRSGLLWECEKIIEVKKPKYLLMENVKNLIGKKFKPDFDIWCKWLEEQGYTNYYEVLNAKNFGVAQNRERVFMISILGNHKPYEFPKGFPLEYRLKDFLESQVEEKYYLSEEIQNRFKVKNQGSNIVGTTAPDFRTIGQRDLVYGQDGNMGALVATDYKQPKQIIEVGNASTFEKSQAGRVISDEGLSMTICSGCHGYAMGYIQETDIKPKRLGGVFDNDDGTKHQAGSIWSKDCISPTLDTMQGGWRTPLITEEDTDKLIFVGGIGDKKWIEDGKENSRNFPQGNRVYSSEGICCTQTSQGGGIGSYTGLYTIEDRVEYNGEEIDLPIVVSSRGRNPENPSDRRSGIHLEQRLEPNLSGTTNTLTSVQKDNYILEIDKRQTFKLKQSGENVIGEMGGELWEKRHEQTRRVYDIETVAPTIPTSQGGGVHPKILESEYRIRKLTPKECFLLMGLNLEQIEKIDRAGISDSQKYKLAGNSIVVNCLEHIFKSLLC